ncbi:MAG: SH3 domain-containing protein [Gemmatimonadota bacterium]|jgi:hypothetical protein
MSRSGWWLPSLLFLTAFCLSPSPGTGQERRLAVHAENVRWYEAADTSSSALGTLARGTVLELVSSEGEWHLVSDGERTGWVHDDFVVVLGAPPAPGAEPPAAEPEAVEAETAEPSLSPEELRAALDRHLRALRETESSAERVRVKDSIVALGDYAANAVPELERMVEDDEFNVSYGARITLEGLGPLAAAAAPRFMKWLEDESETRRTWGVSILLKIAPEQARAAIVRLARTDPSTGVRRAALAAVTSPATLADIVRNDAYEPVRVAALQRLNDARTLGALLREGLPAELEDRAMARLDDRDVLVDLATGPPGELRFAAMARLPSFVLADLATTHTDPGVRLDAVWVLTDAAVLRSIGQNDADPAVRAAAAISANGKVTDVRLGGLDCKPDPNRRGWHDCHVRLENHGTVAYTHLKYTLGAGLGSPPICRLPGSLEPGATAEHVLPLYSGALGGLVEFRIVGKRKTRPAGG